MRANTATVTAVRRVMLISFASRAWVSGLMKNPACQGRRQKAKGRSDGQREHVGLPHPEIVEIMLGWWPDRIALDENLGRRPTARTLQGPGKRSGC
jgi:hypothetical protein